MRYNTIYMVQCNIIYDATQYIFYIVQYHLYDRV